MACSFVVIRNGQTTQVTSTGIKSDIAHGNPKGDQGGTGKFTTNVRSSGPVSPK